MADEKLKIKKSNKQQDEMLKQLNVYAYKFFAVIIGLIVIGIFYGFYEYLHRPKYDDIVSNTKVLTKRKEYENQQVYLKEILELEKIYKAIPSDKIAKVNQIVMQDSPMAELYQQVEYIGRMQGMVTAQISMVPLDDSYSLIDIAGVSKKSTYLSQSKMNKQKIKVSYEQVGYESLMKALAVIENNMRLMDVVRVEYDPANNTAKMEIMVYQLKEEALAEVRRTSNLPQQ